MTSLSESSESLILGLEKAEADLQAIAHRLEEGFELQYGRHQVNPCTLAHRIRKLENPLQRRQLPELQRECRELLTVKQELVDGAKLQLIGNRQALESLEHKSGSTVSGSADVYDGFVLAVAEWDKSLALSQSQDGKDGNLNQALLDSVLETE